MQRTKKIIMRIFKISNILNTEILIEKPSLQEIYDYIMINIKDKNNYNVEEYKDGDFIDWMYADYFINNYKYCEDPPECLIDID